MRHGKGNKKLSKPTDQRIALLRSLSIALFINERIETTTVRAKEAQRMIDKVITLGKDGSLHSRRLALKIIPNVTVISKVFNDIAPRFTERPGGYTRMINTGFRRGDAASLSILEFVD